MLVEMEAKNLSCECLTEFVGESRVAPVDAPDRSPASPTWPIDYVTVIPSLDKAVPGRST